MENGALGNDGISPQQMFLPKETFGRKAGVIDEMVHNCKLWPQQQHHFHFISGYIKKKEKQL